jgi:sugar phosphate isomerase/epimerase
MRFAICNELFQDWDWSRALDLTVECGYSGWEIAPFTLSTNPVKLSAAERSRIASQIRSAGVEVVGLHWLLAKTEGFHLTRPEPEIRGRTADYLGELAVLCRDLGGELMVLGSPQQRNFDPEQMTHEQATENAISVLQRLIPKLEQTQVTLALEPLGPGEGNFWNHASQVVEVIQRLESPWIRLHLDVKAMSTEGKPIDQIIQENAGWLHHFHANDPNLLGPGMGEIAFEPIFEALERVDYRGWVSVEVFDYAPGIERIARESMANMRAAIGATDR